MAIGQSCADCAKKIAWICPKIPEVPGSAGVQTQQHVVPESPAKNKRRSLHVPNVDYLTGFVSAFGMDLSEGCKSLLDKEDFRGLSIEDLRQPTAEVGGCCVCSTTYVDVP